MLSRRTFLKASVAAASGLILPSWIERAETFLKIEGKPLFESLPTHRQTLYASDYWGKGLYELSLDYQDPEPDHDLTWQQFIEKFAEGQEEFDELLEQRSEDGQALSLEEEVGSDLFYRYWDEKYAPEARANALLSNLDLGPELIGGSATGGIYTGYMLMNTGARYVASADNELSLSLLQKRLNDIDGTIAIELA